MKILGMEKMSLVDYDGYVSATLFTGGCNFLCPFCHNSPLVVNFQSQSELEQNEVLSYLEKRFGLLDGVCVSGGEPTLYKDLPAFIEKIKNIGYKVKLDTNGTNPNVLKSLFENGLIDYCAMDIKNDKANYARIIGFSEYNTANVESSVDFLINNKFDYEFRTTLIDDFHDYQNVKNIGEWIKGANKYFLQKFVDHGSCIEQGLSGVSLEKAKEFLQILSPFVKNVNLRGYDL